MLAVTFQEPGRVAVEERPDPELAAPDDAIVRIEATGICGSDLHIYHGRVQIEPGFTIGHEFVGTVEAVGDSVTNVAEGDRVLGTFHTACGTCFFCRKGLFQKCDDARVYGHGATLGNLQGTQAERALVPHANLGLRRVPDGVSDAAALFAGDVMGTGYHAVVDAGIKPGDSVVGVYAERQQVHMGLVWIKNLTLVTGHANVIAHLDPVLSLMQAGLIDISPLVSREVPLSDAPDAYEAYAQHSALKIVLRP